MYYVYMLKSKGIKSVTYVGYTKNLQNRIRLHNTGKGAKFTRGRKWKLIYQKKYFSRNKAMSEEYKLKKNYKLRNEIKKKFINENFRCRLLWSYLSDGE